MTDWVPSEALGRRVLCGTEYATVRYVGSVPPTAGIWLGVEWDDPQRGKHDGTYEGTQYFKCSHKNSGLRSVQTQVLLSFLPLTLASSRLLEKFGRTRKASKRRIIYPSKQGKFWSRFSYCSKESVWIE
ncbi:tubulin-specific chaperone E-like isoform 1-T7 [Amazona ochrocephala]